MIADVDGKARIFQEEIIRPGARGDPRAVISITPWSWQTTRNMD